jgi:hypothetical protein
MVSNSHGPRKGVSPIGLVFIELRFLYQVTIFFVLPFYLQSVLEKFSKLCKNVYRGM